MSRRCNALEPILFRIAEGEAGPDEAMAMARHLPDCTHCRIRLARERRLASMLEDELSDDLPVGEEFVDAVMACLPARPPVERARRLRRGLKLAGLATGLVGLPISLAGRLGRLEPGIDLPALPRPELDAGEGALTALAGLARLAAVGMQTAADLPGSLGGVPAGLLGAALLVAPAITALGLIAALGALGTRSLLRLDA